MRIRQLLIVGLSVAVAVVGLRLVLNEHGGRQLAAMDLAQNEMQLISRDAAGLLVLAQDYLLHNSPRAVRQWVAVHAELDQALHRFEPVGPALRADLGDLRVVVDSVPTLFAGLQEAIASPGVQGLSGQVETLADQLVAETRRISDAAFDVTARLTDQRHSLISRQQQISLAADIALLLLVLAIVAILRRRLLLPIASLHGTAQAVRAGDLSARNPDCGHDEIGELARNFDAMTAALQQRDAEAARAQAVLRGSIEALDDAFALFDPDDRLVLSNQRYKDMYPRCADLMLPGNRFEQIVRIGAERGQYPEAVGRVDAWMEERMALHRQDFSRLIQPLADGRTLRIV